MTDSIEKKCLANGVKLTDQRKTIARVISESKKTYGEADHPDVDELYKRVSNIDPKISIATVYRTVKLFEESGILMKHDFKDGKARYELNDDHNHLIDIKSGNIIEFTDEEIVDRLILIMVNEAVRCLEEEVVNSPKDVDFGMIMGTGWAPFRGGPISYLDNVGAVKVVQKLNELAKKSKYFTPCDMLIEYAEKNKKFYGEK